MLIWWIKLWRDEQNGQKRWRKPGSERLAGFECKKRWRCNCFFFILLLLQTSVVNDCWSEKWSKCGSSSNAARPPDPCSALRNSARTASTSYYNTTWHSFLVFILLGLLFYVHFNILTHTSSSSFRLFASLLFAPFLISPQPPFDCLCNVPISQNTVLCSGTSSGVKCSEKNWKTEAIMSWGQELWVSHVYQCTL